MTTLTDVQNSWTALLAKKAKDYYVEFQTWGQAVVDWLNNVTVLSFVGISTSSATIQTGTQTINVGANKAYGAGTTIMVAHDASNFMLAVVASYTNDATGALTFTVAVTPGTTSGSGTYTAWTVTLSGPLGAQGTVDEGQLMLHADAFS